MGSACLPDAGGPWPVQVSRPLAVDFAVEFVNRPAGRFILRFGSAESQGGGRCRSAGPGSRCICRCFCGDAPQCAIGNVL